MEKLKEHWQFFVFFIGLIIFYCWGISLVPFHPDESTQVYMSQDFNEYFTDPLSLAYRPGNTITPIIRYRAIDAPLTRYLIGSSRLIFNISEQTADWEWDSEWEVNKRIGALPSSSPLFFSRLFPTILTLISILLCYFSYSKFLPKWLSLALVIYLGLNPLLLLHGRRAMAEPVLIFGVSLFIWMISSLNTNPYLLGLVLALAINAKQSAIGLLPTAIIATCFLSDENFHLRKMLANICYLLLTTGAITLILNPFYWLFPLQAMKLSLSTRQALSSAHLTTFLGNEIPSIGIRIGAAVNNLFLNNLVYSEVGNLPPEILSNINSYESIFLHNWGRNIISGSLILAISLVGLFILIKRIKPSSVETRSRSLLYIISLISLSISIILFLPIPWQRYIFPLVPLTTLGLGFGILPFVDRSEVIHNKT